MRNVKFLWGMIGCLLLLLAVLAWDYGGILGSRKVAIVGDVTLTEADWTKELKGKYGQLVLDKMIDYEVVMQAAKSNGISVSDEEMELEFNKLKDRFPNQQEFLAQMSEATGPAQEDIRHEIRYYLLLEKLATMDVDISEEEMFRYYEENRSKYYQPELVRISAIYISNETEAGQVVGELKRGADFSTLAKERSTDVYSAASGGDLGWLSLQGGDVEQEILDQALIMKKEEISEPIALEKGYVVIKLINKKEAVVRTFADVKEEIRRELAVAQVGSIEHVLERMRKGVGVKVFSN